MAVATRGQGFSLVRAPRAFRCADFSLPNNNSSQLSIPIASLGAMTANSFTMMGWFFKPAAVSGNDSEAFMLFDSTHAHFISIRIGSLNQQLTAHSDAASLSNFFDCTPNATWYFFCLASDATNGFSAARKRGTKLTTGTFATTSGSPLPDTYRISNTLTDVENWQGYIAGVKTWDRRLSSADVLRESMQLAPVIDGGLVSYLRMDGGGAGQVNRDEACSKVWSRNGTIATQNISPAVA